MYTQVYDRCEDGSLCDLTVGFQKVLPFKFRRDIIAGFMHLEKKKVTTWSKLRVSQ